MSRYEKAVASVRKHESIMEAIMKGLEKNEQMEYTKPYDKAVGIVVALEEHGFKITRVPKKDGLTPGLNYAKYGRNKW